MGFGELVWVKSCEINSVNIGSKGENCQGFDKLQLKGSMQ